MVDYATQKLKKNNTLFRRVKGDAIVITVDDEKGEVMMYRTKVYVKYRSRGLLSIHAVRSQFKNVPVIARHQTRVFQEIKDDICQRTINNPNIQALY